MVAVQALWGFDGVNGGTGGGPDDFGIPIESTYIGAEFRVDLIGLFEFPAGCCLSTMFDVGGSGTFGVVVSDEVVVFEGEGVVVGLPSFGLSTGAAKDFGWAIFRSLTCLYSYLFWPSLWLPTSILNTDLETLSSTLKGPSK